MHFIVVVIAITWHLTHGLASERRPWEVLRFVEQSSKFVTLPFVGRTSKASIRPNDIVWTADGSNSFSMAPLDDVVMGGASASTFDTNTGTWSGIVTDANNGGFIGIRSTPAFLWDCSSCQGLMWKVRLGGSSVKRFKFVTRDNTEFNGITWTTSVDLKPGMNTVKIFFGKQVPALFARTVANQKFRKETVSAVQVSFSKFEYDGGMNPKFKLGDVNLQLIELRAF